MVQKYLDAGGRVLILIDPDTDPKLDDIFNSWNVKVGKNLVIDNSAAARATGIGPTNPIVTTYGSSPITNKLDGTITIFPMARTVSIADAQKPDPQLVELVKTSENSFTIPKLPVPAKGQDRVELRFDPKTDQRGPLSLAVSAERQSGKTDARLVVIGNSAFAVNPYLGFQRNGDLFYNSIDWLAHQESLISIRPKSPANRRVTLTQAQSIILNWFDLLILPGIVIVTGVLIWWKRR
jgi:gliding motility-associatede transport system auxiliary component